MLRVHPLAVLKNALSYDTETGIFIWIKPLSNRVKAGDVAGSNSHGYTTIAYDKRSYRAHHLAIYFVTGAYPTTDVDHKNGIPQDNSFKNLRADGPMVNAQNRTRPSRNNRSGILGVYLCSTTGRWRVQILADGIKVHVGRFNTPELAQAAYIDAKRKLHEGNML